MSNLKSDNPVSSHIKSMVIMYLGLPKEVYVLFFGKLISCIGAFIYPLLTLILTQKLRLSVSTASKFIAFNLVCQLICVLIGGKLVDTIGRKKVMVIFPSLSALFYIICGIIHTSKILIVFIFLASMIASLASSSYDSMIADVTDESTRKASYSLIYMGLNLGYAVGPLLGGFLFKNYFPLIFYGDGITTLASSLLAFFMLKETYDVKNHRSISNLSPEPDINKPSLETAEKGSIFKVLIKRPILIYYFILTTAFSFTYSQLIFSLPIRLQELFGDNSSVLFGAITTVNGLIIMFFTPLITLLTKKVRIITAISLGALLYSVGFTMFGSSNRLIIFYSAITIISFGEIAISTNSGTLINNLTPASHRGRINAIMPLSYNIGNILGTTIMGSLIGTLGTSFPFYCVGLVVFFASILTYLLNYIKVTPDKDSSDISLKSI
ncbi:MAG: MFS transporter [Clostridium sp.]|nr:MFS transporter [Clostridium sp.]